MEVITLQYVNSMIRACGIFFNDAEVQRSIFSKIQRGIRKVKVDMQQAATPLFYIRREPIQVDTSIMNGVDDNDDGSTNCT